MNNNRYLGAALFASLIINIFCVSALVTGWLAPPPPMPGGGGRPLPPEAHALFEKVAPHRQPGFRQSVDAIHEQLETVRAALAAEPFDAKRLASAFAVLRHAESEGALLAHQRIIDVAATMTVEERKQLQQFVGNRPGRPPGPPPMSPK